MKPLHPSRRQFGAGLTAASLLGPTIRSHAMASLPEPLFPALTGQALFADVETYAGFGIHHTGLEADLKTSDWQQAHLEKLGFAVTRSAVPVRQYISDVATLTLKEGTQISVHPQWPQPFESFAHAGALVDRVTAPDAPIAKDALVLVRTKGNTIDTAENLAQITPAIEAGAGAVIAISTHDSGQFQIGNVSEKLPPFNVPVVLAGEKDLTTILQSGTATLTLNGTFKKVQGQSITGRIKRGTKWLIVSTPQSGWTTCAGERGPGIAMFRGLATTLAAMDDGPSLCFTSNSGHEFHNLGARILHEAHELPPPKETALWLHLGAGFASRAWSADNWQITHSDDHKQAIIMATPDLAKRADLDFASKFAGLNAATVSTDTFNVGEMLDVVAQGYDPSIGVVGYHSHHHVVGDTPQTTAPHLLEGMAEAIVDLMGLVFP